MKNLIAIVTIIVLLMAACLVYTHCQVENTDRPADRTTDGDPRPTNDWRVVYVVNPFGENPETKQILIESRTFDGLILLIDERIPDEDGDVSIRCITRDYYYNCEYRPAEGVIP